MAIVAVLIVAVVWFGLRWHKSIPTENNPPRSACGVHCGSERWAVKTLSDEEAACVNFTPRHTTVSWLVSQDVPMRLPEQSRSGTIECQVWKLTGHLLEFKAEDDGDFHIVLADLEKPDLTMIVEIPDPSCVGVCDSPHRAEMVEARESFTQVFGLPSRRFQRVTQTVMVTVTGVGFFDFKHRQTGLAPNGIELHPVIGFQVDNMPRP
jgi:hypothetical protein